MAVEMLSETVMPDWAEVLDAEERLRATRFVQAADRRAFIAAHLLLRAALQEATGQNAASWRFVTRALGKPMLDPAHGQERLEFNLSHTRGAVACALAFDYVIGVDIEDSLRRNAISGIAESYFAPAEIRWLRAAGPEGAGRVFYTLWTLKEAFIKALGTGLSQPLDSFAFYPAGGEIAFSAPPTERAADWQFHHVTPDGRHHLALAVRRGPYDAPASFSIREITLPELKLALSRIRSKE
jgi:4'-phosphopantetheinyl transferase